MAKTGYTELLLNDFLFNAGVVGLIRIFRYADGFCGGCVEGKDYVIDGQSLYVSNDFLQNRDLGELFVSAMVYYLGTATKHERVMGQKSRLDTLYAEPDVDGRQWKKDVDALYKEFSDMLLKNSYKSGYVILSGKEGITVPTEDAISDMKAEKDYLRKKQKYDALWSMLQQPKVREILVFKDLIYSVIKMFYSDNKGNGPAFFSSREIEPAKAFDDTFLEPARQMLAQEKNSAACISCGQAFDKKLKASITQFVDTADDLGKKKSYYWNCNPDAYLCPMCALICALAPIGFTGLGNDAVFINNNSDVETLMSFADAVETSGQGEERNEWYKLYNTFTSQKIQNVMHRVSNIQVIIREQTDSGDSRYTFNTVDKRVLEVFRACAGEFRSIQSKYTAQNGNYINVYKGVINNVVMHRSQYPFIADLLRSSLSSGDRNTGYLFEILSIQITQLGGNGVKDDIKRAYAAKKQGEALRAKFTQGVSEADADNRLRGLVYQMLSAVSLGNREKFMELAIRTYAGQNMPVPDIFFGCFESDEDFKQIGFAYLLGLKSAGYKKEEVTL